MLLVAFFYLLLFIVGMLIYGFYRMVHSHFHKIRINRFIEIIEYKQDFLFMSQREFVQLVMEVLRRKGYRVRITDRCGEDENGLELNGLQYAEVLKTSLNEMIEVESAMKLARCMWRNQICRGIIITLGEFKPNTRYYCHGHVISCMDGNQLVSMCKEVRRGNGALEWAE